MQELGGCVVVPVGSVLPFRDVGQSGVSALAEGGKQQEGRQRGRQTANPFYQMPHIL